MSGLIPLGSRPRLRTYLEDLWARREFVYRLASGELRSQHLDSVLGNVWHLLNPLLLVGVYYLLFGVLLERTRDDLVAQHISFIAFLTLGILVFGFMQRCFTAGANAIVGKIGLVRTLQFPRAVLPISTVTKETLSFGPSAIVIVSVLLLTGTRPTWSWLLFGPLFAAMTLFSLGGALVTARLADQVNDVKNVLPFAFRLLFYLSGVLFDVERIAQARPSLEPLADLFLLNPFYVFVTLSRVYLLGLSSNLDVGMLWLSAAGWAVGLFLFGLFFFVAAEKRYGRG